LPRAFLAFGKVFAEGFLSFAEGSRLSAKKSDTVVIETTLNDKFDGINLIYFACCTYFIILIKLFLA
jgi:hypothetical protein